MSDGRSGGGAFCSGTLIDDGWVLTAGHCGDAMVAYGEEGYDVWEVLVTSDVYGATTASATVLDIVFHPDWEGYTEDGTDFALLELDGDLGVDPMPVNDDEIGEEREGEDLRWIGFGGQDVEGDGFGIKRVADIPLVIVEDRLVVGIDNSDGEAACPGDSGGAALEKLSDGRYELVGVTSFLASYGELACGHSYSVAGRVDVVTSWIDDYANVRSASADDNDNYGGTEPTGSDGIEEDDHLGSAGFGADDEGGCAGCGSATGGVPGWLLGLGAVFWRRR